MIRGLAAMALVFALAGCGADVPPPASAPAPSATPAPLAAGTYTSTAFQPAVTFTVPDGWVLDTDSPTYLFLRPADSDVIGIHLFRDPLAASQGADCPAAAEPGVGTTSSQLSSWIRSRPGLVVSTPAMATIGGLPATALDIALKADWAQSCPFANGAPSVPLFNSPAIDHWVVVGNERLRVYLVDLPRGGTVAVDLDAFDGNLIGDLLTRSSDVVRSLRFATPDGSAGPSAAPSGGGSAPASPVPVSPAPPASPTPSAS